MLAYFMTSPAAAITQSLCHSASPNSQPSSTASSPVLVRAQQLVAAAKKRHRKQAAPVHGVPVLSRSIRRYIGFGAALTS
jgi:hypothetical protein